MKNRYKLIIIFFYLFIKNLLIKIIFYLLCYLLCFLKKYEYNDIIEYKNKSKKCFNKLLSEES